LRTLAAQVAIAIEDARLFNSQREEAWYLNVMLQVAENLSQTTNLDEALETVVRITPLLVGVARCAILLYDSAAESFTVAKSYGLTTEQEAALREMSFRVDESRALAKVRQELTPLIVQDPLASDLIRPEIRELLGLRAMLLAPLTTRGELVGAMMVDQGTRVRDFTRHEIEVAMGIANQAAVAIESARLTSEAEGKKRFEYELGMARQIQESFLPEACPVLPDYDICSMWQTAREVGGDFYDFIPLTGGRWGIVVADVSDKGMAAALYMALSRTIIRTMVIGKPTPHEAIDRSNDVILTDAHSEMFVTVFLAVLDPPRGTFTYANAGHNPPLLYRAATRQVTALREHGIALGVIPNISLEDHEVTLELGDLVLMYTDGVTEAMNALEEEFGAERLADLVATHGHKSAEAVVDEILNAVKEFTGGGPYADDLTMVIVKKVRQNE
ncbi:MAG TPA: GAF domain-containing SpoIIE family protein phosphatase, partial [Anaerolineae bacterium]